MNVMLVLSLLFMCLVAVQVKAQDIDKCDPNRHCLTCSGVSYNCATCPKGFYLTRDRAYHSCEKCRSNCEECEHHSLCSACNIKNHYGRDCQSVCSKGCFNSTCHQLSGTCLCKENYDGRHCDYCAKGKYGFDTNCTKDCPANCFTCISDKRCTECKDSFYGTTCELSCSKGCFGGRCSLNDGICYKNRCKFNFDGIHCDQCSLGQYGKDCQSICPANCTSCSSKTTCDQCKDGYWGDACQYNCSNGCLAGVCLKESGICQDNECRSGFVGEKCDRCIFGRHGLNCSKNETIFGNDSSASTTDLQMYQLAVVVLLCSVDVIGTMSDMI